MGYYSPPAKRQYMRFLLLWLCATAKSQISLRICFLLVLSCHGPYISFVIADFNVLFYAFALYINNNNELELVLLQQKQMSHPPFFVQFQMEIMEKKISK